MNICDIFAALCGNSPHVRALRDHRHRNENVAREAVKMKDDIKKTSVNWMEQAEVVATAPKEDGVEYELPVKVNGVRAPRLEESGRFDGYPYRPRYTDSTNDE